MNYIKEINPFYETIERKFTVAASILRLKSGLTDSSFKRARTELKEKGYIDYQSRNKNQAPVYRMVSLVLEVNQEVDWDENQGMNQQADHLTNRDATKDLDTNYHTNQDKNQRTDRVTDHHMDRQTDPLIKQKKDQKKSNKIKINDTAVTTDSFVFYQENFSVITPFVADALMTWVNDVGDDLVLDAMKRALDQGKGN